MTGSSRVALISVQLGSGARALYLPPVSSIEIRGAALKVGELVAAGTLRRQQWHIDGREWNQVSARGFVYLRFVTEDGVKSDLNGPRSSFHLRGPHCFLGRQHVAAFIPGEGLWREIGTDRRWQVIRIASDE